MTIVLITDAAFSGAAGGGILNAFLSFLGNGQFARGLAVWLERSFPLGLIVIVTGIWLIYWSTTSVQNAVIRWQEWRDEDTNPPTPE